MKKLTGHALARHYFEDDQEFPEHAYGILAAYEEAARLAQNSARAAVQFGTLDYFRKAQWYEAVTLAFESCLASLTPNGLTGNENYDICVIPELPEFSKHD